MEEKMTRQARVSATISGCLTPREQQILVHITMGETNPRIAAALSLSIKTVEWHRTNLMKKLAMHTVADLVRYAIRNGLVVDDE
jgi:DNA-binding NarL/FixJ family response regulator